MGGPLQYGQFNTCPTDIVGEIAEHLQADTRTLHSFARVCQSTVVVTRSVLFRDCYVQIGENRHRLTQFVKLLRGENNIAVSIQAIRLGSDSSDGFERTPITLYEVVSLLKALPVVKRLYLDSLDWMPSPHSLFIDFQHTSLCQLYLDSIVCGTEQESPLELLRLCSRWATVTVKDLQCAESTTYMQTGPHKADRLKLNWFPFTGGWRLGIPNPMDALSDIKHLEITDIVDEVTGLVKQLVQENKAALQTLTLELCPIFRVYRYRSFFEICAELRWCTQIQYMSIKIPASHKYLDKSPHRPGTVGGHIEIMKMLVHFMPPSVRCVHLQIDTQVSDSLEEAKRTTTRIAIWKPLAEELAAKQNVQGVRFSVLYDGDNRPNWTRRRKRMINNIHKKTYPIKKGSIAKDCVSFYRSEAGRVEADSIYMRYT
ncbi:hypothetical protein EIP86_006647 [Pleurotus ostreatoroseus]|nr:hypothetical protein EIP86_006647 [Pleurotus ostreatoroseus]